MPKNLVIVESPAKTRTLSRFLGKDFEILATIGHVIDLPKSKIGIDVEDGFKVRFGVRWMVAKRVELNGYLAWTDLDFSDNASAAFNGIFDLTKRFGIGGGFEWGDNWKSARVFARFNFGPRG